MATKPTKINTAKFMGSAHAAGSSLAKKVSDNSRKITILKNIIKSRKIDIGDKLKTDTDTNNQSIISSLNETNAILNSIGNALALDFANRIAEEKDAIRRDKIQALNQKRINKENRLETNKGIFSSLSSFGKKMGKKGGFGGLLGLIMKILTPFAAIGAGLFVNQAFKFFSNPANIQKIKDIFNWVKDAFDKVVGWASNAKEWFIEQMNNSFMDTVKSIVYDIIGPMFGSLTETMMNTLSELGLSFGMSEEDKVAMMMTIYQNDKEAIIADLEAARSNDRADLHKRFGLKSGFNFGARNAEIDELIHHVRTGETKSYGWNSNADQRRVGGNVTKGRMYQFHKDEVLEAPFTGTVHRNINSLQRANRRAVFHFEELEPIIKARGDIVPDSGDPVTPFVDISPINSNNTWMVISPKIYDFEQFITGIPAENS